MSTFLKLLKESLNSSKISKEEFQKLTDEYNKLSDADKANYDKTPMVFLPTKKDIEIKANEENEEFTYSIEERVDFLENKISAFSNSATSNIFKTIGLIIINAVVNYFLINEGGRDAPTIAIGVSVVVIIVVIVMWSKLYDSFGNEIGDNKK